MQFSLHIFCTTFFLFLWQVGVSQSCPQISTYFGKTQFDEFKGICSDDKGNLYAVGNTYSNDLPVTPGAFQTVYKSNYESFIVKFDSCGTLAWCTYFGSQGFDSAEKIAYSNDSSIVIVGYTNGADLDTTYNCFQDVNKGSYDCFIAKFNLAGQAKWITYFGGTNADLAYDVTVDKSCNIIIGGTTLSSTLYTTSQSFQPSLSGATDAFIAKFNKNGVHLFSTYYGGNNSEDIHALTTDADKNIIGVGGSFSSNLSTSSLCQQPSTNGGMDAYVLKLDSAGTRIFSTYLGGSGTDDAYGVNTDNFKNIYLTGHTNSSDFYQTTVAGQTVIAGSNDNYCLKLNPAGTLLWSTIFGGSSFDNNVRSSINSGNEIVSLINTQSPDFPMLGVNNYTTFNGSGDLLTAVITPAGQVKWTSYKGGSGGETGNDLVIRNSKVFLTGATGSPDFPVNTGNYQLTNSGQEDGFITTTTIPFVLSSLGNNEQESCATYSRQEAENLCLEISCDKLVTVRVRDILGKEVAVFYADRDHSVISLGSINRLQLYFLTATDERNNLLFTQKIFRQ
jgi:hypothetical protein